MDFVPILNDDLYFQCPDFESLRLYAAGGDSTDTDHAQARSTDYWTLYP